MKNLEIVLAVLLLLSLLVLYFSAISMGAKIDRLRNDVEVVIAHEEECNLNLIDCRIDIQETWTCPEIEDALDCVERDRDAWKEMATNCVADVLEVKAR